MKTVLVTGASGFIGRHTLPLLVSQGYEVHAVSRSELLAEGVTWHKGDVLKPEEVSELVRVIQPTYVLHMAWIATPGVYAESPENTAWLESSLHLFRECIRHGVTRIVGTGSCFEYDWSTGDCDENDTPLNATTFYGRKKAECCRALMRLAEEEKISAAWGRVFYLFGPHEPEKKLIASVIRSLVLNEEVPLTHGKQVRDFLYVEDVASALVALLESGVEGPVNIASGKPITIGELVTKAARILGREHLLKFGTKEASPNDPPRITALTRRLTKDVGWTESIGLEEGLKRTIEWWKKNQ